MGIIKDSKRLRDILHERLKQIYPSNRGHGFVNIAVVKDAEERGLKITPETLSRYISGKKEKSNLSEVQITWLCFRYGIPIQLAIGKPIIENNKFVFVIPKYKESESLGLLREVFGNGKN
jgi:hypothetical protein